MDTLANHYFVTKQVNEMSEKKKRTRNVRTAEQRVADMKRDLAQAEAKLASKRLLTAVKDGAVADDNVKEYKKLLRQLKVIEKTPQIFADFGLSSAEAEASKLRDKIIKKLNSLLDEDNNDDEEIEGEEFEEDDSDDDSSDDEEDDDDDDEDFDDEDAG